MNNQVQRLILILVVLTLQSCANQGIYSSQYLKKDNEPNEFTSDVIGVELTLPRGTEWELAHDKASSDEYIKEWIPKGESINTYSWIIVEQKLHFGHSDTALTTHLTLFDVARKACVDVLVFGPDQIDVNGHKTTAGRAICSNQRGKSYGTLMDQRIIASGNYAFIITSELRTPPSNKAGVIKFENQYDSALLSRRQDVSSKFIRQNLKVCFKSTGTCE